MSHYNDREFYCQGPKAGGSVMRTTPGLHPEATAVCVRLSGTLYLQCYSKDSPELGCFPLETRLFFIFDSQDACIIEGQEERDKMGVAGIRYA